MHPQPYAEAAVVFGVVVVSDVVVVLDVNFLTTWQEYSGPNMLALALMQMAIRDGVRE